MSCTKTFIQAVVDKPYAYFKLDEPTPMIALVDQLGGPSMGIVFGAGGTSTTGKIETALVLGDGIILQTVSTAHWVFGDAFTVRIWYYANFNAFSFLVLDTEQWEISNIANDATTFKFRIRANTMAGNKDLLSDPVIYGEWHRMICSFEVGTGLKILTDNNPSSSLAFSDPLTTYPTVRLRQFGNYATQNNILDEVAAWKHILTTSQITQDWNGGAGTTYP